MRCSAAREVSISADLLGLRGAGLDTEHLRHLAMALDHDQLRVRQDALGELGDLPGRAVALAELGAEGLGQHLLDALRRRGAIGDHRLRDIAEDGLRALEQPRQHRVLHRAVILHLVDQQMLDAPVRVADALEAHLEIDQREHIGIFEPPALGRLEQLRTAEPVEQPLVAVAQRRLLGHVGQLGLDLGALLGRDIVVVVDADLLLDALGDALERSLSGSRACLAKISARNQSGTRRPAKPEIARLELLLLDLRHIGVEIAQEARPSP